MTTQKEANVGRSIYENRREKLITLEVQIVETREHSIAVITGDQEMRSGRKRDKWYWLPLSKVEVHHLPNGHAEIELPEWLAIEKGLV